MRATERMTLAVAVALMLASTPLMTLTEDRRIFLLTFLLVALSAGIAILGRRLGVPEALTRVLVLLPGFVLLAGFVGTRLPRMITDTGAYVAVSYAPMPPHNGFLVLSAVVAWLVYLILELLAVGLDHPAWTFPVLVLPYLIPCFVLPTEVSPLYLALASVGYVLVLATSAYGPVSAGATGGTSGLLRGIGIAAGGAFLLAWLGTGALSVAVPERMVSRWDPGQGSGTVQLGDPSLDLVRNLRQPTDRTVITYRPADGQPHYLRLAALPSFDAAGFHLVATDLMPGPLPDPPGMTRRPALTTLEISVEDFASEWLPAPWPPESYQAAGDWRYDPQTLAIVAVGPTRKLATRDLDYTVSAWNLRPTGADLAAATAGDPGDGGLTLALPDGLDPRLGELASGATAGASTAGAQAVALVNWFHSGDFEYSTAVAEGSTLDTVNSFLLNDRTGYCEQFAGSMAILARLLGIPSRVVVGFLPGSPVDDGSGTYAVSIRQMHAWPELYLDGLGWVPFDPTPSGDAGTTPVPSSSASELPEPSVSISNSAQTPTLTPQLPASPGGFTPANLLPWAVGLAGLLVLSATPFLVRQWRRWRRLAPGRDPVVMAEDAWDEVRDEVVDAGHGWPVGTPRQTAEDLAPILDPPAAAAARLLALEVERARFAPTLTAGTDVATPTRRVRTALRQNRVRTHPARRVFPRSVVSLRK